MNLLWRDIKEFFRTTFCRHNYKGGVYFADECFSILICGKCGEVALK